MLVRDFSGLMQMKLHWVLNTQMHYSWYCIIQLIQASMKAQFMGCYRDSLCDRLMSFVINNQKIPAQLFLSLVNTDAG